MNPIIEGMAKESWESLSATPWGDLPEAIRAMEMERMAAAVVWLEGNASDRMVDAMVNKTTLRATFKAALRAAREEG